MAAGTRCPVRGRLLIFCGIPGSGKTTIASLVAKSDPRAVHIQTDAIRRMIANPTYGREESEFVYGACAELAKRALDDGRLVILDATFGSSRRREKTLRALEGHYTRADMILVACDPQTAMRRNALRSGAAAVPERNVTDMVSNFEEPRGAMKVDSSRDPKAVAGEIVRAMLYPLVPPE